MWSCQPIIWAYIGIVLRFLHSVEELLGFKFFLLANWSQMLAKSMNDYLLSALFFLIVAKK